MNFFQNENNIFLPEIYNFQNAEKQPDEPVRNLPAIYTPQTPTIIQQQKPDFSIGWDITEQPIYDTLGRKVEKYKSIMRTDNGQLLGVVGIDYQPFQNVLFQEVTERMQEISGYTFQGYHTMQKGGIITARFLSESFQIAGHDFLSYLVIGNSHTGGSCFFVGENNTMTRCNNQYAAVGTAARHRHTKNSMQQASYVHHIFANYLSLKKNVIKNLNRLNDAKMHPHQIKALINRLQELPQNGIISERKRENVEILENCINREMKALGNNAFGAFNGVTFWTTHHKQTADPVYAQLFGAKAQAQKKAMNFLNDIIEDVEFE